MEEETSKKIRIYSKWWFWVCMVLIALIIGFVIIMIVAFNSATNGIASVALEIQNIDETATLYTSAGENTVMVEIPNYTDDTKKDKRENIKNTIQYYSEIDGMLNNYSKFILITKMNFDDNEDYFYTINVYNLPDMTEDEDVYKSYVDFIELTKSSLSSSTSSEFTDTNLNTTEEEEVEEQQANKEQEEKDFKSSCSTYTYEQMARNPDNFKYTNVKLSGEVIQTLYTSLYSSTKVELRVNITKSSAYYTDTIYVVYYQDKGDDKILEGDIITLWGISQGEYSYTSVLGSSVTLPYIFAKYISIS